MQSDSRHIIVNSQEEFEKYRKAVDLAGYIFKDARIYKHFPVVLLERTTEDGYCGTRQAKVSNSSPLSSEKIQPCLKGLPVIDDDDEDDEDWYDDEDDEEDDDDYPEPLESTATLGVKEKFLSELKRLGVKS